MSAADFSISTFFCHFLADRPPVDGGSDRIRSDPRRTQADSADFFWVRLSPPESASADALADWLADPIGPDRIRSDPIGSAADPPRTKSADYSPRHAVRFIFGALITSPVILCPLVLFEIFRLMTIVNVQLSNFNLIPIRICTRPQ